MSRFQKISFFSLRRTLTGAAAVAALAAGGAAGAQTKTLYIGMNGGTMEKAYTQYVFPAFEKLYGAKVVVVPGTSSDILAKAQANKDRPQMHVMFLDDGIMVRAIGMGLCQKQRPNPSLAEIYPAARFKDDMASGVSLGMTGLAYNAKMFKEKGWAPPTSWMDLADPKYKGKVVFQSMSSSSFGLHGFLMFNRIQGGNDKNVEPGFKAWPTTIGPNVLEYIPSSAKLSEMVQTGEAAIFPLTPTAVAALKTKGIPVEYAPPKEGAVVLMVGQCVIANNSEPELSQKLAEFLLSPLAQANVLQYGAQIPTNPKAPAVGDGVQQVADINKWMKTAVTIDWDSINANRPAWNARWNKTIEK
ncbi:putative spermidine/putrescine transport system substrate-binding protein [Variovorax beijingensis]|uniref:Putative spermidine/putrescine transport system substrate-binding protein n=1 Tax=Variovorax beijingensis TaxID=2496117 RepID=A0A561C8H3_9BURK|nr:MULTISPECIES: ABC transporter substrate-binding protein [Variovorax]MDP9964033.1 putative spermidine/putrescine transport system substrate-binding protein [Variovorax paradoxus]TWD87509.1 putative spermidine/putrescine transport system substrate-binding protein [Variovorax beijingensis]